MACPRLRRHVGKLLAQVLETGAVHGREEPTEFDMVAMHEIEELSRRIVREFQPDRIILFGSHAYGTPKEYSDVDLLVIMPFEGNSFDQATTILESVHPDYYVDVIVRNPDDTERRYRQFDPLIRAAIDRGTVLHDRAG